MSTTEPREERRERPSGRLRVTHVGELLTMDGADSIVRSACVLIEDGRFVWVGAEQDAPEFEGARIVDAEGGVMTPGLVDAHTHLVHAGHRADEFEMRARGMTYRQIAEAGGGILSSVRRVRQASEDELLEESVARCRWALASGTTTLEVKSGYGLSVADELKMLRVARRLKERVPVEVVPTFLGAHAVPGEYGGRRADYVRLVVEEMLPAVAEQGLAEACDAFVEEGFFSADDARQIMGAARARGLRVRLHVDQLTRSGGARLAAELGADTADHLECAVEEDLEALAEAGVQPVLLPGSVLMLGHTRYPNARAMLERGLDPVLATDFNPGSSPVPGLPLVWTLACTHMGLTPYEAIRASTRSAARALRRADRIGSIEPGKEADFVLFAHPDHRLIPYYAGRSWVRAVFKGGREVYSGGAGSG